MRPLPARTLALLLVASASGCVKRMAVNALADSLSSSGTSSFATDDDLEFVGDAIPFALKTMESLLQATPEHVGLHQALASGFTQYAAVYVQLPADELRWSDTDAFARGTARAKRFYLRARGYGLGGLELDHAGFAGLQSAAVSAALATTRARDVPLLYWTAAAWLSVIALSKDDVEFLGQLPMAASLAQRALELDESWDQGAIHDLLINVEPNLPQPGGVNRARAHFARAVELSQGRRASPYLSLAEAVSVPAQDRAEFVSLLEKGLAINVNASPPDRLANLYAQERARLLLAHADDLFLE